MSTKRSIILLFMLLLAFLSIAISGCFIPDYISPNRVSVVISGSVSYISEGTMEIGVDGSVPRYEALMIDVPVSFGNPVNGTTYGTFEFYSISRGMITREIIADSTITTEGWEGLPLPKGKYLKFRTKTSGTYEGGEPATLWLTIPSVGTKEGVYTLVWYDGGLDISFFGYWTRSKYWITTVEVATASIAGVISLQPSHMVSVEVEAYRDGSVEAKTFGDSAGNYRIFVNKATIYSVEANAPGYEIVPYANGISLVTGESRTGVDLTLRAAWPVFSQDKRHTGRSPDNLVRPPLAVKWSYPLPGHTMSSPVVGPDNVVYVGCLNNKLFAIKDNGGSPTKLWEFTAHGKIISTPAVYNGHVYFGSYDGYSYMYYYSVNTSTGLLRWSYYLAGGVWTGPAVSNGLIYGNYFGASTSSLHAFREDGSVKWNLTTVSPCYPTPAVSNGVVYAVINGKNLSAIASDGTIKWSYPLLGLTYSSPVVSNETIYIGEYQSIDSRFYAIKDLGSNLSFKWSFYTGGRVYGTPAISGNTIYVVATDYNNAAQNRLYALRDNEGNCTVKWIYDYAECYYSSPVIANGVVYISDYDRKLYAIKDHDVSYEVVWSYNAESTMESSVAVSGGRLYAASNNYLYAFEPVQSPVTYESFQVTNLQISREADTFGSAIRLTWDPTGEVDVWATTEGYTSFEGWVKLGSTTNAYWSDPNQVRTGEAEKYYKVVMKDIPRASIYSAEAVGKFNVSIEAGYNLISAPLMSQILNINKAIGNQLSGGIQANADAVYDKQGITSIYKKAYLSAGGNWIDAQTGATSTMEISPAKGYFIYCKGPQAEVLTVVGKVVDSAYLSTLEAGYSLVGGLYPKNIALDTSGLELVANSGIQALADAVYSKQGITSVYDKAYYNSAWLDAVTGNPATWKIARGKGYFYERKNTQMNWSRTKPW